MKSFITAVIATNQLNTTFGDAKLSGKETNQAGIGSAVNGTAVMRSLSRSPWMPANSS